MFYIFTSVYDIGISIDVKNSPNFFFQKQCNGLIKKFLTCSNCSNIPKGQNTEKMGSIAPNVPPPLSHPTLRPSKNGLCMAGLH